MKTEIKNISQCQRELTLTVEAKDAQKDYNKTLNKFRKFVNVPGFRKGKAPVSMIERMFGQHVRDEFIQEQLEVYYKKALEQEETFAITPGEPKTNQWNKNEDFIATYVYEVAPEIDLKKYEGLEIPFEAVELNDEAIDTTIEEMRKKSATYEESTDEIIKDDQVKVEITYTNEEKSIERDIVVGMNQFGDEFNDVIIGTKKGQEFDTTVFSDENKKDVHVKVIESKHLILPELDDEFAKDLDFDNLEAFQASVREELQKELDGQNLQRKTQSIVETLIKENEFDLPVKFLQNYALQLADQYARQYKMPAEQLLPLYQPMAEQQMRRFYLVNAIKKATNLEITDEDKNVVIEDAANSMNISIDEYKEKYAKELETDDFIESVKEQKIFKMIEESSTFVPFPKEEEKAEEEK